jgi:hypothetical protein
MKPMDLGTKVSLRLAELGKEADVPRTDHVPHALPRRQLLS